MLRCPRRHRISAVGHYSGCVEKRPIAATDVRQRLKAKLARSAQNTYPEQTDPIGEVHSTQGEMGTLLHLSCRVGVIAHKFR